MQSLWFYDNLIISSNAQGALVLCLWVALFQNIVYTCSCIWILACDVWKNFRESYICWKDSIEDPAVVECDCVSKSILDYKRYSRIAKVYFPAYMRKLWSMDQSKIKSQVRVYSSLRHIHVLCTYHILCTGTNVVSSESYSHILVSRFEFTHLQPLARSLPMLACDQLWWWMTNLRVPRLSWRVRPWNQGQPQRFALMSMKLTRNLTRDWYVTPVALSYYHSIKVTSHEIFIDPIINLTSVLPEV